MKPLPEIEGSWWGPDKIAHALFIIAVTGWARALIPEFASFALIVAVISGGLWELSNRWVVLSGKRGISVLDFLGFLVGGIVAGILLVIT